jgi:hypothetical protein
VLSAEYQNVILSRGGQSDNIFFIEETPESPGENLYRALVPRWPTPPSVTPNIPPNRQWRSQTQESPRDTEPLAQQVPPVEGQYVHGTPGGNAKSLTSPRTPKEEKRSCQQTRERINPRMRLSERINRPLKAGKPLPGCNATTEGQDDIPTPPSNRRRSALTPECNSPSGSTGH